MKSYFIKMLFNCVNCKEKKAFNIIANRVTFKILKHFPRTWHGQTIVCSMFGDKKQQESKYLLSHEACKVEWWCNRKWYVHCRDTWQGVEKGVERMNIWILLFQFQYLFFCSDKEEKQTRSSAVISLRKFYWKNWQFHKTHIFSF